MPTRSIKFFRILCATCVFPLVFLGYNPCFVSAVGLVPNDHELDKQWYLNQIHAKEAWLNSKGSKNVVVAVLDSGVDLDHPDLKDNIWTNPNEIENGRDTDWNGYVDDIHGWNFVENNNDTNPRIEEGWVELGLHHGTIVAGILGAKGDNGRDIAGVAWNVSIMPLRVLDSKGSGDIRDVVKAIDYAIDKGVQVLNLSFVGFTYNRTLEVAIERAHNAGILIVAAAGNDVSDSTGLNLDAEPMYPVCYDGPEGENWILGVTATDTLDQRAYFASYGNSCVDIAAPGVGILSTVVQQSNVGLNQYTKGGWSGTSVAVPQVAGLAALLFSIRPSLTASEVFDIITYSSDSIDLINPEYKGRLGVGRINVDSAVQLLLGKKVSSLSVLLNPYIITAPSRGSTPEVKIFSTGGHEIKKFMAYHPNFRGGVEVVTADVDGDGYPEIITGAGPGGGPHVRIFSYEGEPIGGFFAFPQNFRGGVHIAAADIDRDGKAEIIAGAGEGMIPVVNIFRPNGLVIDSFMAYTEAFRGGVEVAVGDLEGDGYPEIITGAGPGGGPHVRVFRYDGMPLSGFFAFSETFSGGVHIATGDLCGDGKDEIIVGPGKGNTSGVKVFNSRGKETIGFYAYEPWFRGGVNVSTVDVDTDGKAEILTGPASGYLSKLRIFNSIGLLTANISAYGNTRNGINIAGMWR
ncbi:MAG: S8 family serine peptidase [Patescibacteria group bacterium]|nr:S8 family serine peptidase [Patescibacteria group bacterium]